MMFICVDLPGALGGEGTPSPESGPDGEGAWVSIFSEKDTQPAIPRPIPFSLELILCLAALATWEG